jgi:hypothetical protein
MFLSWTRGSHEPPRHTEVDAESCRNEPIRVQESGNDLGTIAPKHQGKRGGRGRPENRTNQKDRRPGPVCKTSIPGSNPGGASNSQFKFDRLCPSRTSKRLAIGLRWTTNREPERRSVGVKR